MQSHQIRQGLWLAAALCVVSANGPALAREGERWPQLKDAQWQVVRDDGQSGSVKFLSATDRQRLLDMRVRSTTLNSGTASLSLLGGRARSQKTGDGGQLPFDRFSIKEAGLLAHTDLTPGLALVVTGNYSLMKRRPELVRTDGKRLSTSMTSTGLALCDEEGGRIAVDYLSVSPGSRSATTRMAEIMGGAPLAGSGLQLSLSGKGELSGGGVLEWAITGASISRPAMDNEIAGERLAGMDRRATFSLRGIF